MVPEDRTRVRATWRGLGLGGMLLSWVMLPHTRAFVVPVAPLKTATGVSRITMARQPVEVSPLVLRSTSPTQQAPESVSPETRVPLKGLRSETFRHPLDQQATEQLKRLPGLEFVVRRFMGVVEQAILLENIANSVRVCGEQMKPIYDLVVEACEILDLKSVPEVYVKQNPVPNAYTLAVQGKTPFIVLHTSIVDLMTPEELQVVIAHELGHLKCEHGVWVAAANAVALGLYNLGGFVGQMLSRQLQGMLLAWQRAAELSCDRAALLVAQDLDVVLSTFLKLTGGSKSQASSLSTKAFLDQARRFEAASASRIGRLFRAQLEPQLTHPLPIIRVQALDKFYRGPIYTGIIKRAREASHQK